MAKAHTMYYRKKRDSKTINIKNGQLLRKLTMVLAGGENKDTHT